MKAPPAPITVRTLASGFGWLAVCNYSNRILGVLSTLILAKVLSPSDFGLVAIAAMMLEVIQLVKDMGLSEALIYSKREDRVALDTAHTVLFAYNILLFLLAAAAAPFVARFYDNPTIIPVVVLMSSTLVMNSLRVIPLTLIRKNLEYRSMVVPEVVPATTSSIVSIAMALLGFGVWSLVAKALVHGGLSLILLSMVSAYKPRFGFDRTAAWELMHYGKFIAGTSVLLVALYNVDRFLVSSLVGIAALGMFDLAMRVAELPIRQVSFLVGAVMFPVFARMESSGPALNHVFMKTLKYTSVVTVPAAIGISIFGPRLMETLYGTRWEGIQQPLRVVALYAGIRSLSSVIHDLYKATGNPHVMQRIVLFKLIAIASLGAPALHAYGILGMAVLIVLTYSIALTWEIAELARILTMPMSAIVRVLMGPVVVSTLVMVLVYGLFARYWPMESIWHVVLAMMIAGLTYVATIYATDPDLGGDVRALSA